MDDAHVYEMNMQFVGAEHLGCYTHDLCLQEECADEHAQYVFDKMS
jgi:hypothetical protein